MQRLNSRKHVDDEENMEPGDVKEAGRVRSASEVRRKILSGVK